MVLGKHAGIDSLKRYAGIFQRVFGERIGGVERLDLRYPNGFAVRWREAEGPEALPAGEST